MRGPKVPVIGVTPSSICIAETKAWDVEVPGSPVSSTGMYPLRSP